MLIQNQNFNIQNQKRLLRCIALVLYIACLWLAASAPPRAAGSAGQAQEARAPARLKYTKVLEGSLPEFEEITVDTTGACTYDGRKLSDPPTPRPLKLTRATTQTLFDLARSLNYFKAVDLESHKNVANLGRKTITYQADGQEYSSVFNYTVRRDAQALADLFEKVASVEEHVKSLEYAAKYDPLGLPRELLQIRIDLDNGALASAELLVPVLEEIARNSHYLHLAQARAQGILQRVRDNN